jgi:hypothetical protein
MVLSPGRARLGALFAALALLATATPASAAGYDAKNADKVDGKHATSSTTTASKRRNKLVAAGKTGYLPNNIIKMAPNSAKLGGQTLAQVIASATDVYTAGAGLGVEANQFSLLDPFRLPQGCAADEVAQFDDPGWGCLSLPEGASYTAGDGLDLTGTVFSLEPAGVGESHLAFDPATQAELDTVATDVVALDTRVDGAETDLDAVESDLDALGTAGSLNDAGNPVAWTKLKGVPSGFADGVDDGGGPASDVACSGPCVSVPELAFDPATQSELDVHKGSADHDGRYFAEFELQSIGPGVNTAGNPVDWTRLKNVPAAFADGNDADTNTTYTPGTGLQLSGTTFSVNTTTIQSRVANSCVAGQAIRAIGADGSVTCADATYNAGTGLSLVGNTFSVNFSGSGSSNLAAHSNHNHDATLWKRAGNAGTAPGTDFIGTTDVQALEIKVANQRVMRYEPTAVTPNVVGGYSGNNATADVWGAVIAGGGQLDSGWVNRVTDSIGTVSGGVNNQAGNGAGTVGDAVLATVGGGQDNVAGGARSTISGGGSNLAADDYSSIGGGFNNDAGGDWATVAGGVGNNAAAMSATIGGGSQNQATISGATIAGGNSNSVSGNNGAIGGGLSNDATGASSFIGGGSNNEAGGGSSVVGGGTGNVVGGFGSQTFIGGGNLNSATASLATIGGGDSNDATNTYAFVGGGSGNTASGFLGTVAGGDTNTASGGQSTVPGGASNTAAGDWSFAAGRRAKANHQGSFVWADAAFADMASSAANQFIVRAGGGMYLQSDSTLDSQGGFLNTSTGASLSTGGTWTNASDANLKTGFHSANGVATLEALSRMPISTWSYKAEDGNVIHIGPTAQDFAAAFDVGADDRSIATVDADGVALSAIQGLYELVQDQQAQIERLERLVLQGGGMSSVR